MRIVASWLLLALALALLALSIVNLVMKVRRGDYVEAASNVGIGLILSAALWKGGLSLRRKADASASAPTATPEVD